MITFPTLLTAVALPMPCSRPILLDPSSRDFDFCLLPLRCLVDSSLFCAMHPSPPSSDLPAQRCRRLLYKLDMLP